MSDIKCLVCKGVHFRKGYYDADVKLNIHSRILGEDDKDIYTEDIDSTVDIDLRMQGNEDDYMDDYKEEYKYICEDCGYIMSFIQEKNVKSKEQNQKEKQKANNYDWTHFK